MKHWVYIIKNPEGLLYKGITPSCSPVYSTAPEDYFSSLEGAKHYELKNHLGNVLATVSDKRDVEVDGSNNVESYTAKISDVSFYYPFGSLMPGLSDFGGEHRFGFQGQQKDNEVRNVNGSHIDFKYRPYNADLGRFWKVDPLFKDYPWNSSYAFAENRVVDGVELEGREYLPHWAWKSVGVFKQDAKSIENKVKEGINNLAGKGSKTTGYAGVTAAILFGGAPGIIVGIPTLGLMIGADVSGNEDAPRGTGEVIGMIYDVNVEKKTGMESRTGRAIGGLAESLLTSPVNRLRMGQDASISMNKVGMKADEVLGTIGVGLSVGNVSSELSKPPLARPLEENSCVDDCSGPN